MTWEELDSVLTTCQQATQAQQHAVMQRDASACWAATQTLQRTWHVLQSIRLNDWPPAQQHALVQRLRVWHAQLVALADVLTWRLQHASEDGEPLPTSRSVW